MSIAKLFIEGKLEAEVLNPILQGSPALLRGGSKNALRPRALTERRENKVSAGYLRDRDFDFDPPLHMECPTIDSYDSGVPFGWRWSRHEFENYLIEPAIVNEAMGWSTDGFKEVICQTAGKIRFYEASRWAVGVVRRALPPHYELMTRPEGLNDIELPPSLDSAAVNAWASENIKNHREPIVARTDSAAVKMSLDAFASRFNDVFVADAANVLVWFSGKDLLAGMADWLLAKGIASPGAFRASLRDWIIANPRRAIELLPEWNGLIGVLRA